MNEAEERARAIVADVHKNLENIESEEDAKIQSINRMFSESLEWPFSDFRAERHHENGFSDYLLYVKDNPALIIEAKRLGVIDVATAEKSRVRYLKVSGSSLKSALPGIEQAASYATPNGLPLAVLTDGITWIVFKTFIPGFNYKNKEAIVFPSLDAVLDDFSLFYDLLSRRQYGKRIYNTVFDQIHNKRLVLSQHLIAPIEENNILLSPKSELAFDLERVFSKFFSRLAGDDDEDLLIECFVETRESRIADFSLEKITTSVLGNIVPADVSVDTELASLIASSVDADKSFDDSGQSIFIVGPTGAGKTTFLDRFFRRTLPNAIRKRCVVLNINCLDASGRDDIALQWLTEQLINMLEHAIYEDGSPSWEELVGLYYGEYQRRAKGVGAQLYKQDRARFKIEFAEYLEDKVESDREGYLKRILQDVVRSRKLLPIIVIDNTDEFSLEYKQQFFQFAQSLRRHANHCLVMFPVTDKSAWAFSKTDIFSIYQSRSFFLPTPSPREVFRKRIEFLNKKIFEERGESGRRQYFLSKGIGLSIENIQGFAKVLENVFVDHDYTSKTIGELTNYNIRRTLALSQRVITSSVIKIEHLVKAYVSGEMVTTNFTMFMEALMRGNYEVYKRGDNPEIYPIFQVDSEVKQSPLLLLRLLALLSSIYHAGRSIEERHIGVQSIIEYFDTLMCPEVAVEKALIALLDAGLVEPFDISDTALSNDQKLAISYRGIAHLRLASHNSVFFYQMALTTALANEEVVQQIRSLYDSNIAFLSKVQKAKELFSNHLMAEDGKYIRFDREHNQYACQSKLLDDLGQFSKISRSHGEELAAVLGEEYREGIIRKNVVAVVDFYDRTKGFGFADLDDGSDRTYVSSDSLTEFGINMLNDGDRILCDIARGQKGIYIDRIYEVQPDPDIEVKECTVVKIFPDRGYGFVQVQDSERTAFFHVSLFSSERRQSIEVGDHFQAEICVDKRNRGLQVRQVLDEVDNKSASGNSAK
ncbi:MULTISPECIES: AAA family ATPase [Thiorhodovibrio]|uniref:AAA family ATPase n=1 Tax=Thiorhodovibrio TaxID=61593 RepID=UPI0019133216|nr:MULTISPECIES: AAA family ATPase [Thiorhodovibrio]